ncbi:hypothetical protein MTO96_008281 [Rhipicephalus appendiculatus]
MPPPCRRRLFDWPTRRRHVGKGGKGMRGAFGGNVGFGRCVVPVVAVRFGDDKRARAKRVAVGRGAPPLTWQSHRIVTACLLLLLSFFFRSRFGALEKEKSKNDRILWARRLRTSKYEWTSEEYDR